MKRVFADTQYWLALIDPRDQWHGRAAEVSAALGPVSLTTTDDVLAEFLAGTAKAGPGLRRRAAAHVRAMWDRPDVEVVPQSRTLFESGLDLYEARHDKQYSLIDCISMQTMRSLGLTDVLTHDHHFEQEGFTILL
jgi:predicted nucleic acid-binding protein